MAATKTKASSGGSSSKTRKKPQKQPALKDPFSFVEDFRDQVVDAIDDLYNEGNTEAADLFRQLRKQIDVTLPEVVAAREKRLEQEAQVELDRERQEAATKKARAA